MDERFIDRATNLSSINKLRVNQYLYSPTVETENLNASNLNVNGTLTTTTIKSIIESSNPTVASASGSNCIGEVRGFSQTFTDLRWGNYPTFMTASLTAGLWMLTATLEFTGNRTPEFSTISFPDSNLPGFLRSLGVGTGNQYVQTPSVMYLSTQSQTFNIPLFMSSRPYDDDVNYSGICRFQAVRLG